jgi:hypothetical protein
MPRVDYNGLIADLREEDLQEGVAFLSQCTSAERMQILASVRKSLDEGLHFVKTGKDNFSEQQLRNIANDIGIWFAGEILAGRAEKYKTPVQ